MKLIAGLGNPGKKYEATRHNIGFMVVDFLADIWKLDFSKTKEKGLIAEGYHNHEKILLVKPQTYMNLSGVCVGGLVNFYKIPVENVIVIYDDLDLEIGTIRIRPSGSSGGHKGMQSIINHLNTNEIIRIKLGIGRNEDATIDHVLGIFDHKEWEIIKRVIPKAGEAVEKLLSGDIERAMNLYNRKYLD
ncbi:aminoacyl-tRNA hydrolase [Desulfitibacter alkalitolerans]|uniref:aminoacyl-tRNA hydrolase n=1 Tax=Desulfitibacter alkalitolerans TaxID=264641 RepID=UPI000489720A|nr:aminoacyl-tRNA hydrolase [Desulfitibacter alkalitolerans]